MKIKSSGLKPNPNGALGTHVGCRGKTYNHAKDVFLITLEANFAKLLRHLSGLLPDYDTYLVSIGIIYRNKCRRAHLSGKYVACLERWL